MIEKDLVAAPGTPERALLDTLDLGRLPRHVAVIMDGNGRWARQRHLPRVEGHRAGASAVRETVETAARLRLDALTLYAFSTENWKRPKAEVSTLFALLKEYLRREFRSLVENDIRFRVVGRPDGLDPSVRSALSTALEATASCRGMVFSVALNYSGRAEIADAARALARDAAEGRLDPESIDEAAVARRLYTADLPDPDLLIRTSGELRISNFLLWQIAYAEIHVTPVLWPDFRRRHLLEALLDYQRRERRYGGVTEEDASAPGAPPAPAALGA
ncbi:MAG TPA: isoprenyl transferase [Thermoanaerobaculia bacterium]|jgi:undecaprenyl diphosphate synthase|nr:isoprenyl transferase [Thermoanaerobaculia bacterium]HPA51237.1 isoprenyl transferase [Thermoanaerobaculia bacterium]HQN07456.1 isoprenyl transferase [Thermoanaerobaculia bacterium]HQP86438.1 isoprenyl transferase [Thermoanaerobaculia bacterium]